MGFAEECFGAAGFVEELERELGAGGVLLYLDVVAGVGGEHEEFALGHLMLNLFDELEAVLLGHGDVAEEELGGEGSGSGEAFGGGVDGLGFVAVGLEDESESIGDQAVIVDDQNTLFHETPRAHLHGGNLFLLA